VTGNVLARIRQYVMECLTYAEEARRPIDFVRVMRVRLSQSKVGPLACPRRITVDVNLRSFGNDVRLRSHSTDISVLKEVVIARNYETVVRASGDAQTIVDLGANTGLAARWLLERLPHARIVSVEPEPGNVAVLRHNLRPYGDRARVIAACIGGWERRVALVGSAGEEHGYAMIDSEDGSIEVVTMNRVFAELAAHRVDLLKCDIEGAEQELFENGAAWVANVGVMHVECHGEFTARRLVETLAAGGVTSRQLRFESTPQFGCEQVVLAVSGGSAQA
jgi:FkbM family methyltransferase